MLALKFENKRLHIADVPKPKVDGEAVVRVLKSGICNTDIEICGGYADFSGTIGHEFVGVVEEIEEAAAHLLGRRVVGEINAGCGNCEFCEKNDARHCPRRTVLGIKNRDGAHAEFLTLPAKNLLEVADEISDAQAVFVEPLAAACAIAEQVEISRDARVAVVGDGKLGNLCAQTLALRSNNLFLIGKHKEKLALLKNCNVETLLLEDALKMEKSFDIAVEASGSASGFGLALDLLKPRGRLVLKSTFSGKTNLEMWRVVVDEISVVGSRCGRFAPAIRLLENKKILVENLISEEFKLSNGVEAMRRAKEKGAMKIILSNAN